MSNRMGVGLLASISLAVGAVAVAQQRDDPPAIFGSTGPRTLELPTVIAVDPEADGQPFTIDQEAEERVLEAPDPIGSGSGSSAAPDSNAFISAGTRQAVEAIDTLSAEREGLMARLKTVDEELARWQAIRDGLASAKGVVIRPNPTLVPLPHVSPPGGAEKLELEPLPEPSGR